MNSISPIPEAPASRRAALYLASAGGAQHNSPALINCARHARLQGMRVVTVVSEDQLSDGPSAGLGGRRLQTLIRRLGLGQFDVIVAHIGQTMFTIDSPEVRETVH